MRTVAFLDTSVLLELLSVPGKSQQPTTIKTEMRERIAVGESLLLPTAAIIETGNHIAQLPDGGARRRYAGSLVTVLRATSSAQPPYVLNGATWDSDLIRALCDGVRGCLPLPDMAGQGVGTGDVSILAEAAAYEQRVAGVSVQIWTLDEGLRAYA